MGVGYPVDLVVCSALGVDMFDCVYPCRTARFGSALTSCGKINLTQNKFKMDFGPLDPNCNCMTCKHYTRAMLHSICAKEQLVANLLTYHNLYYLKKLMWSLRQSIIEGAFPSFVRNFMKQQFPDLIYPRWVVEALQYVGIALDSPSHSEDVAST